MKSLKPLAAGAFLLSLISLETGALAAEEKSSTKVKRTESVQAGRSVNIGRNKTMQLPAPPDFFFINKQGKRAIPYLLYQANPYREGLAAVLIADQWGYIDKAGTLIIGADYELAGEFAEGLAPVKVKDKWGYIDRTGKMIIEPRFAGAEPFRNGFAAVQLSKDSPEFPKKANDQLAAILKDPNMPASKKALLAIANSRAAGIIDKNGKFIFEPYYSSVQNFSEGLALAKEGAHIVYLNKNGQAVLRPDCQDAKPFSDGLAAVRVKDKWGFINPKGEIVIKPTFDDVQEFYGGLAAAGSNKRWGFINKRGRWAIQPKYDTIWEGFQTGFAIVGKDMCPIENTHADVTRVGSGFLVARRTGNSRGFDESTTALEPGYYAYPDFRFTIIDKNEKQINEKSFEHLGALSDGVRLVRIDGKFGYTDLFGNTFIEPRFKTAESFSDGMALVKEGRTKPRSVERNETMLRQIVPALVSDPDLIRKDIEVCTEVIKLDPSNAQAFRDRGYLLCSLSRFKESLADFTEVTKLCSSSSEGYYWRGMSNMQLSRFSDAAVDFTNAIEMDPTKPQNLFGRAIALKALKRNEMALADINRAIVLYDHPYYRRTRGEILDELGQHEEALVDLQASRKAPILDPWPVGPRTLNDLMLQATAQHNQLALAKDDPKNHERIALLAAEQADTLDELRRLKNREDKVLELEDILTRAIELRKLALTNAMADTKDGAKPDVYKSDLSTSLAQLAGFYVRAKQFDKAAPLYEEALKLAREFNSPIKEADFLLDLAKLNAARKDFDKSQDYLKQSLAITANKNEAPFKILRGQALCEQALVLRHLDKALESDAAFNEASDLLSFGSELAFLPSPPPLPDNASAEDAYELALQCKSLGLIESSRSYMKEAIQRSSTAQTKDKADRFITAYLPKKPVTLQLTKTFQKGRTAELTGDLLNAEKLYKTCIETSLDFEWAYEALARLCRVQSDIETAERSARKSVALNPNYVEGWLELARINREKNDFLKAKEAINKALKLDPDSQLAQFESKLNSSMTSDR